MAKTEVRNEAGDSGRASFTATSEPSYEAKVEAPPSPPSSPRPSTDSLTLSRLYSFNSSPNNIFTLTDSSTAPPPPPPQNDNHNIYPVIGIMRDQELGKATLALAIPISLALLTSGKNKPAQSEMSFILIALSLGCAAIWYGILLRNTFPKSAQVLEPLGIALVFVSFNGLVAFLLPVEFRWVPAVCIALSLLPFVIAARQAQPGPS